MRFFAFAFLLLSATLPATTTDQELAEKWMGQNAIPLQTVQAGNSFVDLEPLEKVVGDARIVEPGEATHGTREFFQLKHRIIEFLASRKGFTIFSIEANMPEAYRLNEYALHGTGDPRQLLKGMYFWTWNTEEVLDMILWMREFNKSRKGRMEFTGFDMQFPAASLDIVREFVRRYDPDYLASMGQTFEELFGINAAGGNLPAKVTSVDARFAELPCRRS